MTVEYDRRKEIATIEGCTLRQQQLIIQQVEAQTAIPADEAGWELNSVDGTFTVTGVVDQADLAAVFGVLGMALSHV